jgi:hypothetical protein
VFVGCPACASVGDDVAPADGGSDEAASAVADAGADGEPVPVEGGADAGRAPAHHRPDDSPCTAPAGAGSCSCKSGGNCSGAQFTCKDDTDCADAGTNGRCANSVGPAGCYCAHDVCSGDTGCPTDETCACRGSPYVYGWGNSCVPGNCRVDADCGAGGWCSPSAATLSLDAGNYQSGYYCHTPEDQCMDDADCNAATGNTCVFSAPDGHWECQFYGPPL